MKPGKQATAQPRLDLRDLWDRLGEKPPGPVQEDPRPERAKPPRRPDKPAA